MWEAPPTVQRASIVCLLLLFEAPACVRACVLSWCCVLSVRVCVCVERERACVKSAVILRFPVYKCDCDKGGGGGGPGGETF